MRSDEVSVEGFRLQCGPFEAVRIAVVLEKRRMPGEHHCNDGTVVAVADVREVVRDQVHVLDRVEKSESDFIADGFRKVDYAYWIALSIGI